MTTESGAPAGLSPAPADDGVSALTIEDARALIDQMPDEDPEQKPGDGAEKPPATPDKNSAPEGDDVDPETDPHDDAEADDPEENLPPIERPRSWAKELDEEWASYPREAQQRIAAREQERDAAIRRSQNELAEQRKAIEAERQAAEKVRQQYEANLPALLQELQSAQQNSFADIRTMDDVVKLQTEDPFRFQAWQVQQMRLQAAKAENDRVMSEKQAAEQSSWAKHVQEENAKAAEFIPDLADKTKGEALTKRVATELLPDLGFSDSELAELANGKNKLSIYDHRIQRLLADSLKLRDIQSAPKAVVKPTLPPVQKPGHAGAVTSTDATIKALEKRFNASGSLEDAWALQEARLKSSQRRAS